MVENLRGCDFFSFREDSVCLIEVASRRPSPHWVPDFLEVDRAASLIETVRQDDQNFGDHSANERTFLAWVRTAIANMAFGFLVEKFDLFLEFAAPSLAGRTLSLPGQKFGDMAGLALIVLGTAMVGIAAARFVMGRVITSANDF